MQKHDWILDVLHDLKDYADKNGLVDLAGAIGSVETTAAWEIDAIYDSISAEPCYLTTLLERANSATLIQFPGVHSLQEICGKPKDDGCVCAICK